MWPVRVHRRDQSLVAHTRAVLSSDPVTRVPPSGEKAHDRTVSVWPSKKYGQGRRDQSLVAHTDVVPSTHPVTRIRPLGAKVQQYGCSGPSSKRLNMSTEPQCRASGARCKRSSTSLCHRLQV
eukprot:3800356-Pyramimonas_sp.AAC.2